MELERDDCHEEHQPVNHVRSYLVIAAVSLLILGLAELSVRIIIHFQYGVPGKSYGIFASHPVLGGDLRANSYSLTREYNDYGFQTAEKVDFRDDVSRIVTYGGSATFCYNLEMARTWAMQLQGQLRKTGHRAQVLNAGVVMWASGHILVKAREHLATVRPRLVIVYSGINEEVNRDFLRIEGRHLGNETMDPQVVPFARNLTQSSWLYQNVVLYKIAHLVGAKLMDWLNPRPQIPFLPYEKATDTELVERTDRVVFNNYLRNLLLLKDVIQDAGARMVFVIQARGRNDEQANRFTAYSRRAASQMIKAGVLVFDPQPALRAEADPLDALITSSGVHYSALGAEKFAGFLASEISPLLAN
jgi:hypothetical protein